MGLVWGHRANSAGFALLSVIVVLSPLPFGANRPFFWFLISALLGLLLLWWGAAALAGRTDGSAAQPVPLARFRIEAALMAALGLWFLLQAAPWAPPSWQHSIWSATVPHLSGATPAISAAPEETMDAWVRFLAYGAVFFLAMQYGRDRNRARVGLWCVALAGIAYSLYGLIVHLGGFDTILWYRRWAYQDSVSATFVNRNSFATFGGIALICCVGLLTRIERRAEAAAAREGHGAYLESLATHGLPLVLGAIVILSAILLSHSRAGLLAVALALAVFYLCRRRRDRNRRGHDDDRRGMARAGDERRRHDRRRRQGWRGITPLVVAAVLLGVVITSGAVTWKRVDREAMDDAAGRMDIYAATLKGIGDRPWLGHGLGSYRWVFEAYRGPALLRAGTIDKAHNSYLDFAFEAGVPAFLLLMALYGRLFVRCLKGVRRRRQDSVYPTVAVASATLLAVHSLVDFSLQIPAVTIVFLFLFGIGFAQSWSSRSA